MKTEEVKLKINRIANDGEGLSRYKNRPVFIYNAIPGEVILCDIHLNKRHVYEGEVKEIIEKSPKRIDMQKPIEETVGMTLTHLNYFDTLVYKREKVSFLFNTKIRKQTRRTIIENTISAERQTHYRNETLVPVLNIRKKLFWGLYKTGSNIVLKTKEHLAQNRLLSNVLNELLITFENNHISAFDRKTNEGIIRALRVRNNDEGQVDVVIIVYSDYDFSPLIEEIKEKNPSIIKIGVLVNNDLRNRDLLIGNYYSIYGDKYFNTSVGGRKYLLSYDSFFQLNYEQTKKLYDEIIKIGQFKGHEKVLDAYSGVGSIGIYIAGLVKSVTSIEIVKEASNANLEALKLNKLKNVNCVTADVIKWVKYNKEKFDVMIFDPPRTGLGYKVCRFILDNMPDTVLYVSCEVETLIEDLEILSEGYNIIKTIPVDMFPHTAHVETITLLKRKRNIKDN